MSSTSNGRFLQDLYGGAWTDPGLERFGPTDITEAVAQAGVVGLGGAAFPTHRKLARDPRRPIRTVVLNGCECEPYLTSDYRLMVEFADACVAGLRSAMKATGAERGVIAIEDNKPAAVAAVRSVMKCQAQCASLELKVCQTKYPMGAERQLIPAIFGRTVPTGGYPLDLGILVINVGTAVAVASAVFRGRSLTHRVVTVSGNGIMQPKNLLVPIGTRFRDVLAYCGGLTSDAQRVIAGGPMMGFTVTDLDSPVTKGTGGITVLTTSDIAEAESTTCVRCGRCYDACPLGLAPTLIAHTARQGNIELAQHHDLLACCECGCCAFVCPAHLPLAQYIRAGKSAVIRERIQKQRRGEKSALA